KPWCAFWLLTGRCYRCTVAVRDGGSGLAARSSWPCPSGWRTACGQVPHSRLPQLDRQLKRQVPPTDAGRARVGTDEIGSWVKALFIVLFRPVHRPVPLSCSCGKTVEPEPEHEQEHDVPARRLSPSGHRSMRPG